jgi:hypothetical protein
LIVPLFPPLWAVWLLAAAGHPPPAAADPTIAAPVTESDGAAVRVLVETVVIDRRGTWSAGSDQADLIPGASGVLKKSIELQAKDARRTREAIEVEARLVPQGQEAGGPACLLALAIETRAASAAPASDHGRGRSLGSVSSSLALRAGEERLVDAYISAKTGGKVALRVRCDTARHEGDDPAGLISIDLEVERRAEGETASVIGDQQLVAMLGRELAVTVSDHTTLAADGDAARFRRERLDIAIEPSIVVAGKLQLEVRVTGDVSTIGGGDATVPHPIDKSETFLLSPLEPRTFEIVIPGGAAEGWSDLHYLVQVRTRF